MWNSILNLDRFSITTHSSWLLYEVVVHLYHIWASSHLRKRHWSSYHIIHIYYWMTITISPRKLKHKENIFSSQPQTLKTHGAEKIDACRMMKKKKLFSTTATGIRKLHFAPKGKKKLLVVVDVRYTWIDNSGSINTQTYLSTYLHPPTYLHPYISYPSRKSPQSTDPHTRPVPIPVPSPSPSPYPYRDSKQIWSFMKKKGSWNHHHFIIIL